MTREQIELKYDEFFGKGYWEEQYKKHIVEFAFQCSNGGKPHVMRAQSAEPLACSSCGLTEDVVLKYGCSAQYCPLRLQANGAAGARHRPAGDPDHPWPLKH